MPTDLRLSEKIAVSGLIVVLTKTLLAGVVVHWGVNGDSFSFGSIDGVVCAAILTPCLGGAHLETWVSKGIKNDNKG